MISQIRPKIFNIFCSFCYSYSPPVPFVFSSLLHLFFAYMLHLIHIRYFHLSLIFPFYYLLFEYQHNYH